MPKIKNIKFTSKPKPNPKPKPKPKPKRKYTKKSNTNKNTNTNKINIKIGNTEKQQQQPQFIPQPIPIIQQQQQPQFIPIYSNPHPVDSYKPLVKQPMFENQQIDNINTENKGFKTPSFYSRNDFNNDMYNNENTQTSSPNQYSNSSSSAIVSNNDIYRKISAYDPNPSPNQFSDVVNEDDIKDEVKEVLNDTIQTVIFNDTKNRKNAYEPAPRPSIFKRMIENDDDEALNRQKASNAPGAYKSTGDPDVDPQETAIISKINSASSSSSSSAYNQNPQYDMFDNLFDNVNVDTVDDNIANNNEKIPILKGYKVYLPLQLKNLRDVLNFKDLLTPEEMDEFDSYRNKNIKKLSEIDDNYTGNIGNLDQALNSFREKRNLPILSVEEKKRNKK